MIKAQHELRREFSGFLRETKDLIRNFEYSFINWTWILQAFSPNRFCSCKSELIIKRKLSLTSQYDNHQRLMMIKFGNKRKHAKKMCQFELKVQTVTVDCAEKKKPDVPVWKPKPMQRCTLHPNQQRVTPLQKSTWNLLFLIFLSLKT